MTDFDALNACQSKPVQYFYQTSPEWTKGIAPHDFAALAKAASASHERKGASEQEKGEKPKTCQR